MSLQVSNEGDRRKTRKNLPVKITNKTITHETYYRENSKARWKKVH